MSAPVATPKEFDRRNEVAFRQFVENELLAAYRKDGDLIIPFGFTLGFTGSNGEEVKFVLNSEGAFVVTVNGSEVINFDADSATFALNNDGRVTGIRLSDGSTTTIDMLANSLRFFDGTTDRALIEAGSGLFTVNGDLAVRGSIRVGEIRWPVALRPVPFYVADGGTIQWASGAALSAVPDYAITVPGGVALASGEAWEPPTIQNATTTGGTLRLKISTPGATASVTDTTDTAGGGGDPDRVMEKADSADAYDGVYYFRVQGTANITSYLDSGFYFHSGGAVLSPWFNDGGGWDEGPTLLVTALDVLGEEFGASDQTGTHAFDVTLPVLWANAIGQHGGNEWGVSYESGGSLTDFVSVQYTKQSVTGTRTGSPNGETALVLVIPKNV